MACFPSHKWLRKRSRPPQCQTRGAAPGVKFVRFNAKSEKRLLGRFTSGLHSLRVTWCVLARWLQYFHLFGGNMVALTTDTNAAYFTSHGANRLRACESGYAHGGCCSGFGFDYLNDVNVIKLQFPAFLTGLLADCPFLALHNAKKRD